MKLKLKDPGSAITHGIAMLLAVAGATPLIVKAARSAELEVNSLAPQDKSQVFGHLYEKGFLIKTKDDKAPELALGWRAKKLNGKYEFKWLYCGRFGQGFEDNYETEGETKTTQTATLKGDFYARQMDGRYECSVDESNLLTEHTEAAAAIKDWFSKVQEKPDVA